MDYYQKYLKYKNKYKILRKKIYGGDLTEEQKITCFNDERFEEIGKGMESIIYLDTTTKFIYKVINKRKDKPKSSLGAWGVCMSQNSQNLAQKSFEKSVKNYKIASDKNLGPKFYGSYTTDKYNIIVMEFIDGYTLEQISSMNDEKRNVEKIPEKPELIKKREELIMELVKLFYPDFKPTDEMIYPPLSDFHDNNFIYSTSHKKLFAIDL